MNKNKKIRYIGYIIILLGLCGLLVAEKFIIERPFSIHRFFILFSIVVVVAMNLIFDFKKMWDIIFKKRYIIGVTIFSFFVLNGYNGSSVGIYYQVVQPNIETRDALPFLGSSRGIRSDEYIVVTPILASQSHLDFPKNNNAIAAENTNVQLYPLYVNKSLSVLATPHNLGFLFLDFEQGYSFFWFAQIFALFFASFELFMLMSKKKKLYSLLGAVLITCSPALQWWNSFSIPLFGILAVLMLHQFLKTNSWKRKLIFSLLIGWFGSCYIFTMYPAWQVPFGYLFLALCVWQIYEHRDTVKWKHLLYLLPAIAVIVILLAPAFLAGRESFEILNNTIYPGKRVPKMGSGWEYYYNYFHSIFFPFKNYVNPSDAGQFISLYPLPIIMGCFYAFKNFKEKKHDFLLNALLITAIGLSLFNYLPLDFLSNITMLSMSIPKRIQVIVSLICVMILVKVISDYSRDKAHLNKKVVTCSLVVAVALCFVIYYILSIRPTTTSIYIDFNNEYINLLILGIAALFYIPVFFLFLVNDKRANNLLIGLLISCSLCQLLTINPLGKGLAALQDKPAAKEIQKIVAKDKDARWIGTDSSIYMSNYALANGAKVINSTNYYPYFKFWNILDPTGEKEDIYNRYAHINVILRNEPTEIILKTIDLIELRLNIDDLKKLNINYIVSFANQLEGLNTNEVTLSLQYNQDNVSIYKVNY